MTHSMTDNYGRVIDYLRISVTDRCNLRCVYCMPEEGVPFLPHDDILRYEEIVRIVRIAADLGIHTIRLTGGEPLVRKGIVDLVGMLAAIEDIESVNMTTNGTLLAPMAEELARAGLKRMNISLDSLHAERYAAITRRGNLNDALAGIEAARDAGLCPVKINMVVMGGINDEEVIDFARRSRSHGWHVRFIEVQPLGDQADYAWRQYVSSDAIRRTIEDTLGALTLAEIASKGPSRTWRLPGAEGTIGFISAISHNFCAQCNRLRLTSDGRLVPCLLSDIEFDLRAPLRHGANDDVLRGIFLQAVAAKPRSHHLHQHTTTRHQMSRIGG
ncbi:MAG: GTP 3',8-cyclase MoaA [Chloroflexota bacterium]|nr:GTP 3',8-cyclase MoaA [Chloroflexota bacterium]